MYRVWLLIIVHTVSLAASAASAPEVGVVGAWRFENEVDTRADGTRISVGPKAGYSGFLLYTADGWMMVQIMPRGRSWKRSAVTPEQLRETVQAGDAYYGRYSIDPAAGTVTHYVEGSLDPAEEGTPLVRRFRLDGDRLVLSGAWEYAGEKLNFEITWSRVKYAAGRGRSHEI